MDTNDTGMTTIKISFSLRDKLKHIGRKDETYNDVLIRLFNKLEEAGIKLDGN